MLLFAHRILRYVVVYIVNGVVESGQERELTAIHNDVKYASSKHSMEEWKWSHKTLGSLVHVRLLSRILSYRPADSRTDV